MIADTVIVRQGAIKGMELPSRFEKGEEELGGMGNNWTIPYHPPGRKDVELTFHYRGTPETGISATGCKLLLEKKPHFIFKRPEKAFKIRESVNNTLEALAPILGNAGDNQVTNTNTGMRGPRFNVDKVETIDVNGKTVIAVNGFFHSYKALDDLQTFYYGIFYDATPESIDAQIEEFFYQAETKKAFTEFWEDFYRALNTIVWK